MHVSKLAVTGALGALLAATSAVAAIDPPNPKDLSLGSWVLNVKKAEFCSDSVNRLLGSHRRLFETELGYVTVDTYSRYAGRKEESHVLYNYRYDGAKYPHSIMEADHSVMTYELINPHHIEIRRYTHNPGKEDKLSLLQSRVTSEDAQTMTISEWRPGGTCITVLVYDRVKEPEKK